MNKLRINAFVVTLVTVFSTGFLGLETRAQNLAITPATSSLSIHPGDQAVPLSVAIGSGNSSTVTLSLADLPYGISSAPVTVAPGSTGVLLLNATTNAGTPDFSAEVLGTTGITKSITILASSGSSVATVSIPLTISLSNAAFAPSASQINLPTLSINTGNAGVTSKTVKVPGTMTITSADGSTVYIPSATITDNTVTIAVHGNSTAQMPKLAYNLDLNTSADLLTALGLNCGYVTSSGKATCDKNTHYVLLANYADKSMLRDWAASALALSIPSGSPYLSLPAGSPTPTGTTTLSWWAPHSIFVEMYLNGSYNGTYQLIEKVVLDSHRVNIRSMKQADVTGAPLTGGYLMNINSFADNDYMFTTPQGLPIGMVDPDYSPETPEQEAYISNYVTAAENTLFGNNYTSPTKGWRAYLDETTLVNFYIVNDVMGNLDGGNFCCSDYFYKDETNPLIYMGPVWDFDASAGNVFTSSPIVSPYAPWMLTQANWYKQLITDPTFKASAAKQFNALKANGVFSAWLASIRTQGTALGQAGVNNYQRWPMLGVPVWRNAAVPGTYSGEVSLLTNWLQLRLNYMDSVLNGTQTGQVPLANIDQAVDSVGGTSYVSTANKLNIAGWAASYTDNGPASAVQILVDWVPVGTATLGGSRPDVAAAFGNPAWTNVGWAFSMNASTLSAGVHVLAAVATDSAGLVGASSVTTITVTPASGANLSFVGVSSQAYGAAPFTVSATSTSCGAITYNVASGPATISGNTVTLTGAGTVVLTAGQAACSGYSASAATTSFSVTGVDPQLSFGPIPSQTYTTTPLTVAASSLSSGAMVYSVVSGPATVSGANVSFTGLGTVVLSATQAAAGQYNSSAATTSLNVVAATAGLVFAAIPDQTYGASPLTVAATSASAGAISYSVVSGPAILAGSVLSVTGTGTVALSASQAAAGNYAAGSATVSFKVLSATPTLSFAPIAAQTFGNSTVTLSASSASSGAVTYSVVSGPATIAGSTVTFTGVGTAVLSASQAATSNYTSVTATTSVVVGTAVPLLAFAAISSQSYGNAPFTISAASMSPAAVTYSVTSGPAILAGTTVAMTGVGTVVLSASQAAAGNYAAAAASTTFAVAAQPLARPAGSFDSAVDSITGYSTISQAGSLVMKGWAADVTDQSLIHSVQILIDGVSIGTATLGLSRPDVASYYNVPAWTNSGWTMTYSVAGLSLGSHAVWAVATDAKSINKVFVGTPITVTSATVAKPIGSLDEVDDSVGKTSTISQVNSLVVRGWAADVTDDGPARSVTVYVDNVAVGNATLGISRPDVAAAYNNTAWTNTGWLLNLSGSTLNVGAHTVSVVAKNSGGGATTLGTRTIAVIAGAAPRLPVGSIDEADAGAANTATILQSGSLTVRGWAASYNGTGIVSTMTVYVDGTAIGNATLGLSRPDVAAAYSNPAWTNSGWLLTTSAAGLSVGLHVVTAVATDSAGLTTTLTTHAITVSAGATIQNPIGSFDEADDSQTGATTIPQSDSILFRGWAADYNDNGPVQSVQILVDGNLVGTAGLGLSRADVAYVYGRPTWANTGWSLNVSAATFGVGTHSVAAIITDAEGLHSTLNTPSIVVSK